MTHFLVTGVSGLLGLNFALAVDGKKHQVTGAANTTPMTWVNFKYVQAELTEPGEIEKLIDTYHPDVFLHCAALANVDACEANPTLAGKINADLPGDIAAACGKHSLPLIHISTDAVFDGTKGDYREEDEPHPLGVYASTKLAGEQAVLAAYPQALIARVNFYGWSAAGNRSLAENFVHQLEQGKSMMGFTDVWFCPMNVLDLSALLVEMAEKGLSGIYHAVGPEAMSKYDFGTRIASQFGFDPSLIRPVSVKESGLKAARSPKLSLRTDKLRHQLQHDLPDFSTGLKKFHDQYRRGYPQYIQSLA